MFDRRSLKPWYVCLALILAAGGLVGAKYWSRRSYVEAQRAHEVAFFEQDARWRAMLAPVLTDLRKAERDRSSVDEVLERFKDYNPTPSPMAGYGQVWFVEPRSGATIRVAFNDEHVAYFSYEMASTLPFDRTRWEAIGLAIRWAGGIAFAGWVLGIAMVMTAWPRRPIARVMIGLAVFAGVAWSLDRQLDGLWRVETDAWTFRACVVALVAGVVLFAWPRPHVPNAFRCRQCDYDLTGNVSGRCPECGRVIHESSDALGKPSG
jgi:hypothetical protein